MVWVKADISEETHKRLRHAAIERDVALEELTGEIIEEWNE